MANFDLNISLQENISHSFDLNTIPTNNDNFGDDDYVHVIDDEESEDYTDKNEGVDHQEVNVTSVTKNNLTNDERWIVYSALLAKSINGIINRAATREVSEQLSVHIRTVQRIWKQAKNTPPGVLVDISQRRKKNFGRKKFMIDLQRIADIPLSRRTTLRTLAESLGVSYTTLYNRFKEGLLRRHSNALKSLLKEENKVARLRFCLSMLEPYSLVHEPKFVDMYNIVHIDEKWFYMTKQSEKYYLLPLENDPVRTCQSKNFIGKVMFFAAMARARFDHEGKELFSGKIGIFPFVTNQPAKRRSKNREAGTMEIKPITSVTRDVIKRCLIEEVIPKIFEKWPRDGVGKTIFIQQDNARTHVDPSDEELRQVSSQNDLDIRLICQPPNSPYLNILDLGFFSAIQALQHKVCPKNVEELIHAVKCSYEEYSTKKINHIFLSLQLCMQEIMRIGGSNNYKISHMKKEALEREGLLPKQIICDPTIVKNVINQLES